MNVGETSTNQTAPSLPLSGVRVLELGQLIAGPFCGMMLAAYGADVIKVEPPKIGDAMRSWRTLHEGTSLSWHYLGRNKRSITLDLAKPEGRDLVRRMIGKGVDIVVENFRPGRMEEWGLGFDDLARIRPRIVMVRLSGFGQNGPYAQRPGFASVAEGLGGIRYVTGEPGRPPVRSSISLGDTLAGLHAVIGAMLALRESERTGRGQIVDTAIYESVFNVMEGSLPEFDARGIVRERTGAKLAGIVPSSTYRCKDGIYLIIGGNSDSIFKRLMRAIGREDLASDPRLERNPGRVEHEAMIDDAIAAWAAARSYDEAFSALERAEVPAGPICSMADISRDPHFAARGMFEPVALDENTTVRLPRMTPLLARTPARPATRGPLLGEHNNAVYREWLGLDDAELARLSGDGVI